MLATRHAGAIRSYPTRPIAPAVTLLLAFVGVWLAGFQSVASGSCGDWLDHAAIVPESQVTTPPLPGPAPTPLPMKRCQGPNCQQSPLPPAPPAPARLDQTRRELAEVRFAIDSAPPATLFATCTEQDGKGVEGFPLRLDRPPKAKISERLTYA